MCLLLSRRIIFYSALPEYALLTVKYYSKGNKKGDAWVLPGGRAEVNEKTTDTIIREFVEELGIHIRINRLICIIENFNAYGNESLHEFGLYYLVTPTDEISICDSDFEGIEESIKLTFKWIDIDEIVNYKIYPKMLKDIINQFPDGVKHYINDDKDV